MFREDDEIQGLGLSSSTPKSRSRAAELFWPDVSSEPGQRTAANNGRYASFFIAGLSALVVLVRALPWAGLLDALLFALVGLGLWRMSRVAAAAGLLLYVGEQIYAFTTARGGGNPIMSFIVLALFAGALRGTVAYHHQRRTSAPESTS